MSAHRSEIRPDAHVFLRLPNDTLKLVQIKRNSYVTSVEKYLQKMLRMT
jgi:hypothetical protein